MLSATVGQDADHAHALFLEERPYPIIEQVYCGNRRLGGVELARRPLRISVHEGLLVNSATP